MAGKADFTETEWQTLERGVTGAAMLVSVSDPGFFDSFKEVGALAGYLNEARQKSSSELIRELAATRAHGFGFGTSPQELETGTLDALRVALATLQAKAPEESSAYTAFVVDVSESVAKAVSGESPPETAAIDKIKGALQATGRGAPGGRLRRSLQAVAQAVASGRVHTATLQHLGGAGV